MTDKIYKIKNLVFAIIFISLSAIVFTNCGGDDEESQASALAKNYAGSYIGTVSVTVGGQYTYSTDIEIKITTSSSGTINVYIPQYSLSQTMMGDLTIGEVTINNLSFEESSETFFRNYGGEGITQHFIATKNGTELFNNTYPLNQPSSIRVSQNKNGSISIINPFKLGSMPLDLSMQFNGSPKN